MIIEHIDIFDEHWVKAFLQTFEQSIDSIVITSTSPQERFLYVNEAFKRKTFYTESELLGKSPRILQGPLTNRDILDDLKSKITSGKEFVGQTTNYKKDATPYIVHWYISALKNKTGEIVAYISFQKEVTQNTFDEKELGIFASIITQVDQMITVTDLLGEIVYVNSAFTKKYGYTKDEILNSNINKIKSGKHTKSFYKDLWDTLHSSKSFHGVFFNRHKNGELFIEQKTISPIKNEDGDVNFYVSFAQDITDIMSKNSEYKEKAYKDSLTGLSNRLKFDEILTRKLYEFNKEKNSFSIILMDIDNFKSVNDIHGHDKGDDVLKNLASILQKELRKNDTIARWGGEEFVVIIDAKTQISLEIAEKLRQSIDKNLSLQEQNITVSMGVTEVKDDDTEDSLFKRADEALYKSKENGKNMVTFA
jgi:diguanylate cyclase (GGDEF)-like protein/PAS domain S-box-containing protein